MRCEMVKGLVIDEMWVYRPGLSSRTSGEFLRPQISYPVGNSTYFFVDHNATLEVGEKPTIIFLKSDPHAASVYDFWFWLDFSFIAISIILSVFVFQVIIILTTKFKNETEILPSNF